MTAMLHVSSTQIIVDNYNQADGSRWVREVHMLDNGEVREFYYLCDAADEPEAIASGRAAAINAEVTEPGAEPADASLG